MKGRPETDRPQGGSAEGGRSSTPPGGLLLPALKAISFAAIIGVTAFAGGFGWFANSVSNLVTPRNPQTADAIIVLTGGQSRLSAGLDLLKSGKGKRLLISGVHPAAGRDDLRAATGADKSLFTCCVDIDHAALDTIGNAEESAKWVRTHDYNRVLLVTNNYHMPRSLLEVGRLLDREELAPYPVVNSKLDNGGWIVQPDVLRVLFTEYNKYLVAWARGALPHQIADSAAIANASAAGQD